MTQKPTTTDAEPTRLSDTDDHQPVPLAHRNADAELRVTMLNNEDYTVALVPEDTPLGGSTDSVYRTDTTYDLEAWR